MSTRTEYFAFAAAMTAAMLAGGCSKSQEVSAKSPAASAGAVNVSDFDVTLHVKTALHQNDLLRTR